MKNASPSQFFKPYYQSLKNNANRYIAKWILELSTIDDNRIHAPWLFEDVIEKANYPKPTEVYKKRSRAINRILKSLGIKT